MATCKDCLYEKACVGMLEAMGYKVGTDYKGNADRCDTYTQKSRYAEVKHGEWIAHGYKWRCSCCSMRINIDGTPIDNGLYYCPNCGARMDGGDKK